MDDTSQIGEVDDVGGSVIRRVVLKPTCQQTTEVTIVEYRPWQQPSAEDRRLSVCFDIVGRQEGMAEHKVRELLQAA